MNSIGDSVHKLLVDQIIELGLESVYTVERSRIFAANGTEFRFAGIRSNVSAIKSFEGITIAWLEEAANVSKNSWETLIPTIRREGSEIWVSFNPELDTDETYRRFVLNPPPGAVVIRINHEDNPWFPDVLRGEAEALRERDPDAYLNVWGGHCRQTVDGSVYAKEIRRATEEGRITKVPYDATQPVHVFFDLGERDMTSIWFAQRVGMQNRILDFYEANGEKMAHYFKVLQSKPYIYGTMWLPHDAQSNHVGAEMTIERQARAAGFNVRIVAKLSVADGINAGRNLFDLAWFDEEKTRDGMQNLRRYRYDVDDNGGYSRKPVHDVHSNAADAWRYTALGLRDQVARKINDYKPATTLANFQKGGSSAWMG